MAQIPEKEILEAIADLFKAFGDPTRVQILSHLLAGEMCVGDIAEAVGYEDQNYFSRCFRKVEGRSPTDFRRDMQ